MKSFESFLRLATLVSFLFISTSCTQDGKPSTSQREQESAAKDNGSPDQSSEYTVETENSPTISKVSQHTKSNSSERAEPQHAESRFPAFLPSERALMNGNSMSANAIADVLKSDKFGRLAQRLELENAKDPLAQQIEASQKQELEQRIAKAGAGELKELACGLSLCVGSISVGNNLDGSARFSSDFLQDPSVTAYNMIEHQLRIGKDDYEKRFVISVDPAVNSISAPTNARIKTGG